MARKRHAEEELNEIQERGTAAGAVTSEPVETPGETAGADPQGERILALEREVEEWKDRYSRVLADMENLKRRTQREAEDTRKFANERLISDLLPVHDNFVRALGAAEQSADFDSLKSGVEQIWRLLDDVLCRSGLERIESVGQPFDPNLHEAIMQTTPEDGQEPHQVVEEFRAGFRLNDRVIRPAMVKVTSG